MNSKHIACPHCGQRMQPVRAGARLTPMKAKLFDAIARCTEHGITSDGLIERLALDLTTNSIRAHVWQINNAFERQGLATRIISRDHRWKIVPTKDNRSPHERSKGFGRDSAWRIP